MRRVLVLAAAALCAAACFSQTCSYRHDGQYALPDAACTPGAANPQLMADPSGKSHMVNGVEANVCAKDFRTGPWRKVSEVEKKKACVEYGITSGCPGPQYELDHLISLEIGGSDVVGNLWPQPIGQARVKDHGTEDKLPAMVCGKKTKWNPNGRVYMTLRQAQACISGDWAQCASRVSSLEK